jgi:hypothetical protein
MVPVAENEPITLLNSHPYTIRHILFLPRAHDLKLISAAVFSHGMYPNSSVLDKEVDMILLVDNGRPRSSNLPSTEKCIGSETQLNSVRQRLLRFHEPSERLVRAAKN